MNLSEYIRQDAIGLNALIKTKQVNPNEILDLAIRQIEKTNPKVNAVVNQLYELAQQELKRANPESPLYGVPFLLKDLGLYLKGIPTSYGSRLLADYIPDFDSEIINRYRKAGLIFIGKTNVPELGLVGVTESQHLGPCRNPWSTSLTPGGSSGGSAAAVAARMVPVASADDGGGSIRIPASACGLVGLKPSRGLMPMGPDKSESWLGLVSGHVVSRSLRDTALLLDLSKGACAGTPYLTTPPKEKYSDFLLQSMKGKKIGFSVKSLFGQETHPDCKKAVTNTMQMCRDLGIETEEADLPIDQTEMAFAFLIILACSTAGDLSRAEQTTKKTANLSQIEFATYFLKNTGAKMKAPLLEWAIHRCRKANLIMDNYHQKYDLFCTPTMAHPPASIGLMDMSVLEKIGAVLSPLIPSQILNLTLKQMSSKAFEKTPNTELFNMTGQPAISLPTHWNEENVPIGVQFVAPIGQDQLLLQLGSHLELIIKWQDKIPNLAL
jgi:amidase